MGRFVRHRLAIGVAALVLAATIGAVAWAAPQGQSSTTTTPAVSPQGGAGDGPLGLGGGPGRHGKRGPGMGIKGDLTPEEFAQQMQQREAQRDARRDAFLKLVRDKMTPEEQKQLDALETTAKQQRDALRQAREDLFKTTQDIRALVGKYFPLDDAGTTPPDATVQ